METRSQVIRLKDGARLKLERTFLMVRAGPEEGLEYELRDRPVILGRSPDADLRLDDPTVSREHARLEPDGSGWKIVDLGSKSGVRINGVQVEQAEVEPNFTVALGSSEFQLVRQTSELLAPHNESDDLDGLLGKSPEMRELFGLVKKVGPLELPVLLFGESGTGKESLARALHARGPNPEGPYVVVDCTLLGEGEHMRSELFGHVKGAFTGADRSRDGAFLRAHGGTLFLDEVGELPASLQPQLLRVLQEGEVRPLGGTKVQRVRTRVVSATNRNLADMVAAGQFRQDLYYRLSALIIEVPPLRQRTGDLAVLARHFLPEDIELSGEALRKLEEYAWPGNVRELEFMLKQAAALCSDGRITVDDLQFRPPPSATEVEQAAPSRPAAAASKPAAPPSGEALLGLLSRGSRMSQIEEAAILDALAKFDGNRNKAAEYLGMSRATLFRRLKQMRERAENEAAD